MFDANITIKFKDQNGVEHEYTMQYDNMSVEEERGIMRIGDSFESNGHKRITIKAWSGCRSFDEFQSE